MSDDLSDFKAYLQQVHSEIIDQGLDAIDKLRTRRDHWLIFDIETRDIIGCFCGFAANVDDDCGFGDSVVEHLIDVGRDELRERRGTP